MTEREAEAEGAGGARAVKVEVKNSGLNYRDATGSALLKVAHVEAKPCFGLWW